ncbi:MAG TPA: aldolase/citrate lyase family protein [Solirubrobacteraceae bacterium]|nr:aldolase/citrate lyase family protein [Solirubrobacteraceae bacterium]
MSGPAAALAVRLRAGERLRWLFVKMPAPAEVELAGATGFDAVILDTEHGSPEGLEHHLRAAETAGIPVVVRVPSVDPGPILRALDAGATGVVVAHVVDGAGAAAAVAAAHYPPRGRRGLALTTRAGRHGTAALADHLTRAGRETVVIVQIEDADAVPRSAEILGVDGVDGVLIGATDLSISLGRPGESGHPELVSAVATIADAAAAQGVPVAMVVASAAEATVAPAQVAVFVSTLLVRDAFRSATAPLGSGGTSADAREPLVLLPGMLGTSALWEEVAPRLADLASMRFGRIDLDPSVGEMATSVLAAAPQRFALAGHSLGGIVALAIAQLAPERVSRLCLLNTSAGPPSPEASAAWDALEAAAREGDFGRLAAEFARDSVPASGPNAAQARAATEAMALACGSRALLRQLAAQRGREDLRPILPGVGCPTLVISGLDDTVSPPDRQRELADGIPGARLERLDGVGHMSPLEAPDRVARVLADWLRQDRG